MLYYCTGLESSIETDEPLTLVPVYCEFSVNDTHRITKQASQDNSLPSSLSHTSQGSTATPPTSTVIVVCNFEAKFSYEDTYSIGMYGIECSVRYRYVLNSRVAVVIIYGLKLFVVLLISS